MPKGTRSWTTKKAPLETSEGTGPALVWLVKQQILLFKPPSSRKFVRTANTVTIIKPSLHNSLRVGVLRFLCLLVLLTHDSSYCHYSAMLPVKSWHSAWLLGVPGINTE
jgi:hypothetical protein